MFEQVPLLGMTNEQIPDNTDITVFKHLVMLILHNVFFLLHGYTNVTNTRRSRFNVNSRPLV